MRKYIEAYSGATQTKAYLVSPQERAVAIIQGTYHTRSSVLALLCQLHRDAGLSRPLPSPCQDNGGVRLVFYQLYIRRLFRSHLVVFSFFYSRSLARLRSTCWPRSGSILASITSDRFAAPAEKERENRMAKCKGGGKTDAGCAWRYGLVLDAGSSVG